ncbi:MAG: hypothetical protein NTV14_03835, partial [Coprothermobacterota bacterium]|nr:hypothetical protein [Coprothermobacterota bacterium]
ARQFPQYFPHVRSQYAGTMLIPKQLKPANPNYSPEPTAKGSYAVTSAYEATFRISPGTLCRYKA